MKILKKIILVALIGLSFLLVACGTKPPSVSKQDFDTARLNAENVEGRVRILRNTKSELEAEHQLKTERLEALLIMERE
jgi:starvation-inducible outer membrane lipoprotein